MTIYVLGPFRLDTQAGVLFRGTEPVALGARAIALLQALVQHPGALVSKAALIEVAWPGRTIEDSNLTVQIAALRRVFGEAPGGHRWLETMSRRGYRFIGPIAIEAETGGMAASPPSDTALHPPPTPYNPVERRQVTALSCELIGLSGRADGIGLEDFREALVALQHCVSETVGRHKGFVASRHENTVLVLFGYPAAHEHDAELAVRAGGELCAAVKALSLAANDPAECRIGIATGMVIIGDPALANERWPQEVVGQVLMLAARLQLSAQPGTVVIDRATRRMIGNLFDCRDIGMIESTPEAEPEHRWQVLEERIVESRFQALHGPALSPFVGRDEEVDLLLRRWARAKTSDGQVVLISGEPGLGKSRIATELEKRLSGEPHLCLRYVCSPDHQNSALFPFINELGRRAGFERDDPSTLKQEKLKALLARATQPEEDVAFLAELLSLPASEHHKPPLSPRRKKGRMLEALLRQLEGLARQQPLVMVFEDAHWIDPTSQELLDLIVERASNLALLLLVTFRPEFQPPWTGQPLVTMLVLNRLDRRDRTALIQRIAGGKTLPNEVVAQIADRSDGIPLFMEELTKTLLESGVLREQPDRYVLDGALPPVAIPMTLHASLLARLDRLGPARLVAQIGASIGREFAYEPLRAVSRLPAHELDAALNRLVASGLVFQRGALPDAVYAFRHALVQDAAHASLLRGVRRQLHAQIAEALETLSPELMDAQPELFAHHYAEAGLVEKSVAFWDKARRRSATRAAMAEAHTQLRKGLEQLALLPDTPERQRRELEFRSALGAVLTTVKGYAAPESGQAYARARELWEQLGSPVDFLHVPFGQSRHHLHCGELDVARRLDEDLLRQSRKRNDSAGLVLGHLSAGRNLMYAGLFVRSQSHLEAVLAAYDPMSHHALVQKIAVPPQVVSQAFLGIVLCCLGLPNQALARNAAAITEARRLAQPPSLAAFLSIGTILLSLIGDDAMLGQWAKELNAIAIEYGFPYWRGQATIMAGWVSVKNGDLPEGMSLLHSGLAVYRATGTQNWMPYYTALLAGAHGIAGQIEQGLALLDNALQIVERTGQRWILPELYRRKGQMLRRQGQSMAAEELYRKALGTAAGQGAKLWQLRAAISLAELNRDKGRAAVARDFLAPVYSGFTEGFNTPDLIHAKALLDELT